MKRIECIMLASVVPLAFTVFAICSIGTKRDTESQVYDGGIVFGAITCTAPCAVVAYFAGRKSKEAV